jgi:hypothetical protein
LKEVQRKSKRYKRVVDDNGINSQILVSKEVEKETEKVKKKEEDAQILINQQQGIYLQSGKTTHLQEMNKRLNAVDLIQRHSRDMLQRRRAAAAAHQIA